jgi:uncharacterized membrane protein
MSRKITLKQLTLVSLFSVIIFVLTFAGVQFSFLSALGGYTHLGTLAMFIIAAKYGKYYGMASAAIGMTLFDVLGGWFAWAPGTFVTRLIAGFVFGLFAESSYGQGKSFIKNIVSLLLGGFVILVGYYLFESLFISDFVVAINSIIGNVLQILIASLGLLMIKSLPEMEH